MRSALLAADLIVIEDLNVCGMVRNTGEPGGGPFWVRGADGHCSRQIVEAAQIDAADSAQRALDSEPTCLAETHFSFHEVRLRFTAGALQVFPIRSGLFLPLPDRHLIRLGEQRLHRLERVVGVEDTDPVHLPVDRVRHEPVQGREVMALAG